MAAYMGINTLHDVCISRNDGDFVVQLSSRFQIIHYFGENILPEGVEVDARVVWKFSIAYPVWADLFRAV